MDKNQFGQLLGENQFGQLLGGSAQGLQQESDPSTGRTRNLWVFCFVSRESGEAVKKGDGVLCRDPTQW